MYSQSHFGTLAVTFPNSDRLSPIVEALGVEDARAAYLP